MPKLISTQEAATILGLSKERVIQLIKAGVIPAVRLGDTPNAPYMINPKDLQTARWPRAVKKGG
jgi:excisionase family DNA binding protein